MGSGGQCAIPDGVLKTHPLSADSWALTQTVSPGQGSGSGGVGMICSSAVNFVCT